MPDAHTVWLGNHAAVELSRDRKDKEVRTSVDGKYCTVVRPPAGQSIGETFATITAAVRGVWAMHSDADKPAWVASTSPGLAALLGEHYGCEVRDPEPDNTDEVAG